MKASAVDRLVVRDLESNGPPFVPLCREDPAAGRLPLERDGQVLDIGGVADACRFILRAHRWCRLEFDDRFAVHFGWDYYMYIESDRPCSEAIEHVAGSVGLFVEAIGESPYRRRD